MTASVGWRLDLPWSRPPLTANDRLHWARKARMVREVRCTTAWLARARRIPACDHITVTLWYSPARRVRLDPSNLLATQKPAVDGLRDAGVVVDDDPTHVTERMPLLDGGRLGGMWLVVETP